MCSHVGKAEGIMTGGGPNYLALLYTKLEPVSRQNWTPIEIGRMGPLLTSKLDRDGWSSDECKQNRHQCQTCKQSHCKVRWIVVTLDDIHVRTLLSVYKVLYRLQHFNFQRDYSSSVACSSSHCYILIWKQIISQLIKRPISLPCTVPKFLKRIVYYKVIDSWLLVFVHISLVSSLNGPQFSSYFILHNILSSFTANSQTDVAYLDIRKAFDSIPHNSRLLKLWSV